MELQKTSVMSAPNAFNKLATVSPGREGVLFQVSIGLQTSPPWGTQSPEGKLIVANSYVEGCWHLLRNSTEQLPGQVLGTGLEGFFDSACGFSIVTPGVTPPPPSSDTDGEIRQCSKKPGTSVDTVCSLDGLLFQHPSAGVLHFSSDYTNPDFPKGVARSSACRFFDNEVVGVDNGGGFGWDNGCAGWARTGTNKCGLAPLPKPPTPPTTPPTAHPTQTGPPEVEGCADGTCDAFCSNPQVRGCGVSWTGVQSLRDNRTGKCDTASVRPTCGAPADACATGWELCLSTERFDRARLMPQFTLARTRPTTNAALIPPPVTSPTTPAAVPTEMRGA